MSDTRTAVERKMERIPAAAFSYDDVLRRRDRRDRRHRVTAGIIAFGLFFPIVAWFALASSNGRPDREPATPSDATAAFVRDASRICASGFAEFQRQTPLTAPNGRWPFPRTVAFYRTGLPIFRDVIARLRQLTPPPEIARLADAAIDAHEHSIETTARAVAAGEAGDRHTFNHVIERVFGPMDRRLVATYERIDVHISCP